jgi:hypothetical protein
VFASWSNFYALLGEASASLIGLLFVVATLTAGLERPNTRGVSLFLTPTVFKFAVVLALSAGALAPGLTDVAHRWIVGTIALVGLVNLSAVTLDLCRGKAGALHWSDPWCYGVIPALTFLGLGAAAFFPDPVVAARGVAGGAVLLLMLCVRNAWDLVIALASRVGRRLGAAPTLPLQSQGTDN